MHNKKQRKFSCILYAFLVLV